MILSAIKISGSVKTAEIPTCSSSFFCQWPSCKQQFPTSTKYFSQIFLNIKRVCIINAWGCTEILPSIICKCDSIFSIHGRSDIGKHLAFSLVAVYEEFTPIRNGEYFEWIIINIVCLYSYYWLNNCLGLNVRLRKA